MIDSLSRQPPGGGLNGARPSRTARCLEIILAASFASLFIVAFVRNVQIQYSQSSSWGSELVRVKEHTQASASIHAQVLPGQPFVVTGVRTGFLDTSSWRPTRLEIAEFQRSGPAFDLYLQCLNDLMDRDQEDVLSYYKIAGTRTTSCFVFGC